MGALTAFFTSGPGKAILGWLLNRLWGMADNAIRDALAKSQWESHVKKTLEEYEKVIEDAKVKAQDGLTDEEKEEIRKKKSDLEESIFNGRP